MKIEKSLVKDQGRNNIRLAISGELLLAEAATLRTELINAIAEGDAVEVSCAGVERVDITLFQLLCSAHYSSVLAEKVFCVDRGNSVKYSEWLETIGLKRHVGCSRDLCGSCIWIGGTRI